MIVIPSALRSKFEKRLQAHKIALPQHHRYLKWLRYYLDFCFKYHNIPTNILSFATFTKKLQENNQSTFQQVKAARVIEFFINCWREKSNHPPHYIRARFQFMDSPV